MKIITDEILHLYILNPGLLDKNLLNEIETTIIISRELSERVKKIKDFYKKYENIVPSDNYVYKENEILLYPLEFGHDEINNYARLAANSNNKPENVYKYVKTFFSSENLILLRLHYNPSTKFFKLFLISDDVNSITGVKVKIPELDMEFISDSNGIVDLKNKDITDVKRIIIEKSIG